MILSLLLALKVEFDSPNATVTPSNSENTVRAASLEFTKVQKLILYSTSTGTIFVIFGGAVLTIWCRKRNNVDGRLQFSDDVDPPIPETSTANAEDL
jgi:hypothetical protein